MNPYVIEVILREKRDDMLREAERQRLVAQYEAAQQPPKSRIALTVGDLLIRLGEKLKERYSAKLDLPVG
jgi:hypothetical protein